ncbi:hypothetical protein KC316_g12 [Hortaea werneckii]|nr:hypothetical protein KC316_g12 [Hortaea werneckii]
MPIHTRPLNYVDIMVLAFNLDRYREIGLVKNLQKWHFRPRCSGLSGGRSHFCVSSLSDAAEDNVVVSLPPATSCCCVCGGGPGGGGGSVCVAMPLATAPPATPPAATPATS